MKIILGNSVSDFRFMGGIPKITKGGSDTSLVYSASTDEQVFRSVPYRTEEGYDLAVSEGTFTTSPGGEGAQFFNWMFRSTHNTSDIIGVHDCAVPWVSQDEGATWKKTKSKFLFGRQPQTIVESPDTPGTFFAMISDYDSAGLYGRKWHGIYKSTDYMQTWTMVVQDDNIKTNQTVGTDRYNEHVFVADPALVAGQRAYYYVSGSGSSIQLVRSLDGGTTWENKTIGSTLVGDPGSSSWVQEIAVHPTNHKLYIATDDGLFELIMLQQLTSVLSHLAAAGTWWHCLLLFAPLPDG